MYSENPWVRHIASTQSRPITASILEAIARVVSWSQNMMWPMKSDAGSGGGGNSSRWWGVSTPCALGSWVAVNSLRLFLGRIVFAYLQNHKYRIPHKTTPSSQVP